MGCKLSLLLTLVGYLAVAPVRAQTTDSDGADDTGDTEVPAPVVANPPATETAATPVKSQSESAETLSRRVDELLDRFPGDPSLDELKQAALRFADADRHSARHWKTAPNRAALLPALKFTFDHDMERDETLDRYQDRPDRWGADTDRDFGFQLSAQWKLDELVFNSDEIRVWSALADRAARRQAVLTMLIGYFFERRKLQLTLLLNPPQTLNEMAEIKIRIAELEAALDALTGGYFSKKRGL